MVENFQYYFNRVITWAKLGTPDGYWGTDEHLEVCWKMVEEEYKELYDAFINNDETRVVDGLCDLFVTLAQVVMIGHERNVLGYYPITGWHRIQDLFYTVKYRNILEYRKTGSSITLYEVLCRIFDATTYLIEEALLEVLDSNDSKFPTVEELKAQYGEDEEKALQAASDWIESNSEYKDVVGIIKEGRCIFRCNQGKGKIVKPWTFKEPDLSNCLGDPDGI